MTGTGNSKEAAGNMQQGLVQVYTGEGKGKTTAALGQAMRAAGQGFRVIMLQFMKGNDACGEHLFADRYKAFEIVQVSDKSYFRQTKDEQLQDAQKALEKARELLAGEDWDMVILDEILSARSENLISTEDVLGLLSDRRQTLELVLTGRKCPPEIVERADLVTEMLAIKHPYAEGIPARKGVEF